MKIDELRVFVKHTYRHIVLVKNNQGVRLACVVSYIDVRGESIEDLSDDFLLTSRNKVRYFKSIDTAVQFAKNMGIENNFFYLFCVD